ncbi:MAG: hypothetical protein ABFD97_25465 [Syntrophobacter sp.]
MAAYLEKQAEFVKRLHGRTLDGDLNWYKTESDGVFQFQFPDYLVQVYQRWADDNEDTVYTYISIFNKEGGLIDTFNDTALSESESMGADSTFFMVDLYENARRIAMGMEQALDNLIYILDQEVIPD